MDSTTYLEWAKKGDLEALRTADAALADSVDEHGVSALMWALYYGQPAAAEWIASQRSQLTIFEAAALGRTDVVRTLLQSSPELAHATSPDGFSALGFGAYLGHLDVVRVLLEAGADPNRLSQNAIGAAPLHSALSGGFVEIAKHLVLNGADPNLASQEGWTPLHYCGDLGDADLTRWMMDHGAMSGPVNREGLSASAHARQVGHEEAAAVMEGS